MAKISFIRLACKLLAFVGVLGPASLCAAQEPGIAARRADAIAYLNRALDVMQQHALRRDTVDWRIIRAEALAKAAHAELTVDTYDSIRFALRSLGDHHSSLQLTPGLQRLEAERKGPRASEETTSKTPANAFVGRYEPEGRIVTTGNHSFAIVVVPKCFPDNEAQFVAYETQLQRILAKLDESHPAGWIVDLRGNVGGNMWPMLAGVGPLLGEGVVLGQFFTTDGHSVWRYRDGVASEVEDNGTENRFSAVSGPYKLAGTPRVAVLMDQWTGSAGEALLIAFRGRPNTRLFGERSQGASTANNVFTLSDGAAMWLTVGVDADRSGKKYMQGLDPDESVKPADKAVSDNQDPVLQQALHWLNRPKRGD